MSSSQSTLDGIDHAHHYDSESRLESDFFDRDKHELARELLGRDLVRRLDGATVAGRIVEVEVYGGPDDPASHGDSGEPSERTASMFGSPGDLYVYQIYGRYHCLNIVAPASDKSAAILVRALEPLAGIDTMAAGRGLADDYRGDMPQSTRDELCSGPGKICQALRVDRSLDGSSLTHPDAPLSLHTGAPVLRNRSSHDIERTRRIGLNPDTVGEAAERPWRYVVSNSRYLSR